MKVAHERKVPVSVQIQLTDRCNLRCEFCYNSLVHKEAELSFDEVCDILDQIRALGTLYVCLTGGEPTLHPRFFDICREIKARGFALEMITNGTLMCEAHYDFLAEVKPRYVAISVHGMNADSHERLTRTPESFARTMHSIKNLHERGVKVEIRVPVTRYNQSEVEELVAFADGLGINYRIDCNISHREDFDDSSSGPRMDTDGIREFRVLDWMRRLKKSGPVDLTGNLVEQIDGNHLCAAGNTYAYIDSVGVLHPCPSYQRPIGSLRKASFAELWHGNDFLQKLRAMTYGKVTGCQGCEDKPFCSFCPGDARLEGMDPENGWALYERACTDASSNRQAYQRAFERFQAEQYSA